MYVFIMEDDIVIISVAQCNMYYS